MTNRIDPIFFAALFILNTCLLIAPAKAEDPDAILSPNDSRQMFALTEAEWVANVSQIKAAGVGDVAVAPSGEYTLYMRPAPDLGVVAISPSYGRGSQRPWKLTVTTFYDRQPFAMLYNDEAFTEQDAVRVVKQAVEDMKPDFTVMGYLVRDQVNPPIFTFTIFEKGVFPPMDGLNAAGTVCPTQDGRMLCIRKKMLQ